MIQKSHDDRMLWAQFDSLEMGTGWDDTDILKPQIMVESVYGDSHPGSYHLNDGGAGATVCMSAAASLPSTMPRTSVTAALRAMTA